jgi:hypothetical protein
MSLLAFQLALTDLAASPALCARVAANADEALAGYDLTPVERRRLASAVTQRGMAVNWSLYRYNRITTLVSILPGTIHLLGTEVRDIADEFWAEQPAERNMSRELEHFADWMRRAIARGRVSSPFLPAVLEFEMARYEVAVLPRARLRAEVAAARERAPGGPLALHPLVRVAAFAHEPQALLGRLAVRSPLPYTDIPEGEFYVILDCRGDAGVVWHPLEAPWARAILGHGTPDPAVLEALVAEEILVPAPGALEDDVPALAAAGTV